jgi:hypothetical protein
MKSNNTACPSEPEEPSWRHGADTDIHFSLSTTNVRFGSKAEVAVFKSVELIIQARRAGCVTLQYSELAACAPKSDRRCPDH